MTNSWQLPCIVFQQRHGLEAKGLLGKQTIIALNIPPPSVRSRSCSTWSAGAGCRTIWATNISWSTSPPSNCNSVARRSCRPHECGGRVPLPPRRRNFPTRCNMSSSIPTGPCPTSIATNEMLPKLRANPYAYAADFDVFVNGRPRRGMRLNWCHGFGRRFPFHLPPEAGPKERAWAR